MFINYQTNNIFSLQFGNEANELKDHLGNVRVTFSDIKMPKVPFNGTFEVDLLSKSEYYPYGMKIKDLSYNAVGARYGYNSHEQSTELNLDGNHTTAEFWEYDARSTRRWNNDPRPVTAISPYATFQGNPIMFSDMRGDSIDIRDLYAKENGQLINRLQVQAFEAFASSEEGQNWIADRAQPGFRLKGEIYKDLNINIEKEGNLSKQGVDYKYQLGYKDADKTKTDRTVASIVNNRLKIQVWLDPVSFSSDYEKSVYFTNVYGKLSTFLHETFYHGNNFEKQFKSNNYRLGLDPYGDINGLFIVPITHKHYNTNTTWTDYDVKKSLFGTTAFTILNKVNIEYKLQLNQYNIIHDFMLRGMHGYNYEKISPLINR